MVQIFLAVFFLAIFNVSCIEGIVVENVREFTEPPETPDNPTPTPPPVPPPNTLPVITAISPELASSTGPIVMATISGVNFDNINIVQVLVGANAVTITATSATSIDIQIPTIGAIGVPGFQEDDVVIDTASSGTITLNNGFRFQDGPVIGAISPVEGPIAGGQNLTIMGNNFFSGAVASINGVSCQSSSVTSQNQILCQTPIGTAGTPFNVEVENTDGQNASSVTTYSYVFPVISNISPNIIASSVQNQTITIEGTSLDSSNVFIGTIPCLSQTYSLGPPEQIDCTVAPSIPGVKTITVQDNFGQVVTATILMVGPPIALNVSPLESPESGGIDLSISGVNFSGAAMINIGGNACGATNFISTNSLECDNNPANPAGPHQVIVQDIFGQFSNAGSIEYVASPSIIGVTPSSGLISDNTLITISGSSFHQNSQVFVDGNVCQIMGPSSGTSLQCLTPVGASSGSVIITVENPGGTTATTTFNYLAAPVITGVTPASAPQSIPTNITITGNDFDTVGVSVMIGNQPCVIIPPTSSTAIQCTTSSLIGVINSSVITVINGDGQQATFNSFTLDPLPVLNSISPNVISQGSSPLMTLSGNNFVTGLSVEIGGLACTGPLVLGGSQVQCTLDPSLTTGIQSATITNPDGQSVASLLAIAVNGNPVIGSVIPTQGPSNGGTFLTITGTNFFPGASIEFSNIGSSCLNVNVISSSQITCETPNANTVGVNDVIVQIGTATSSWSSFNFIPAPTITNIIPNAGGIAGGTSVVIQGSDFNNPTVSFGGIQGTVTSTSPTTLPGYRTFGCKCRKRGCCCDQCRRRCDNSC